MGSEKKKNEEWTPDNLSGVALEAFNMLIAPLDNLQHQFLEDLTSYGKKDYTVNAAGVERWVLKMGKAFQKKVDKCGTDYFSENTKRIVREADEVNQRYRRGGHAGGHGGNHSHDKEENKKNKKDKNKNKKDKE